MKHSLKKFLTAALCAGIIGVPIASEAATPVLDVNAPSLKVQAEKLDLVKDWDKVFPKNLKVNHRKVTFVNRFGITLAADIYEPRNYSGKLAAIAVAGPYGAVKEQVSGRYAQAMAEHGFFAVAFDPSFTGESSGYPRNVTSPDLNTEDFCAAVDFLSTQPNVDNQHIGIIGICGWGGFALNAAAQDTRIKATVTSTMYDMTRVTANGYFDNDKDTETLRKERMEARRAASEQRTVDYRSGTYKMAGGVPKEITADMPQFVKDYHDFYQTKRGYHKRSFGSTTGATFSSALSFMNMPILCYSNEIETPVLMIHGEKAHSRYFSEDAFKKLTGSNKELLIVPGASHVDLYDSNKIPFDKIALFFKNNLK
ncbi:MAG: alpha/beta hydrolase [Selenomonadaceae bacterium]|nr:alpha/beta hydrolase [Selenomonadaceae bacterium]